MNVRILFNAVSRTGTRAVASLTLVLALAACEGDSRPFTEAAELHTQGLNRIIVNASDGSIADGQPQDAIALRAGQQVQFNVLGVTDEGIEVDLDAADRSWFSADPTVASISESGLLTAMSNGAASIGVEIGGIRSLGFAVTVNSATLRSINRFEGEEFLERCLPQSYVASGIFSDQSVRVLDTVNWSVDSESGASIVANGAMVTVTAINSGMVRLTAEDGAVSDTQEILVPGSLRDIEISPETTTLSVDQERQYSATGTYDELDNTGALEPMGGQREVTITLSADWSISSGTSIADVVSSGLDQGLVTGLEEGVATLTASCGSISDSLNITVEQ
ncbi:MAG: hypothetical protein KTR32_15180 [Granulosicoccus sp.]|nr:hypothetical protein [Granulosicoccus sp.]